MMAAALLLLKRVPAWAWIALALIGAGWLYGHTCYNAGQADVQAKWDASVERGKAQVARLQAESNRVSTKIVTQYVDRVHVVKEKADAIVRQVPVFVPAGLPLLPGGFRLLHDAAATNEPVPVGSDAADGAPVAPQDVAATVAGNYATDHETAERLISLQDWVYRQCLNNPPPDGCVKPYE